MLACYRLASGYCYILIITNHKFRYIYCCFNRDVELWLFYLRVLQQTGLAVLTGSLLIWSDLHVFSMLQDSGIRISLSLYINTQELTYMKHFSQILVQAYPFCILNPIECARYLANT